MKTSVKLTFQQILMVKEAIVCYLSSPYETTDNEVLLLMYAFQELDKGSARLVKFEEPESESAEVE